MRTCISSDRVIEKRVEEFKAGECFGWGGWVYQVTDSEQPKHVVAVKVENGSIEMFARSGTVKPLRQTKPAEFEYVKN